jgi:fructose-1,6-bisphosphatase/inositol monophosphatase family enzyme
VNIDLDKLTTIAIDVINDIHTAAIRWVRQKPNEYLRPVELPRSTGNKAALYIDVIAEKRARARLRAALNEHNPLIIGEEFGDNEDQPLKPNLDLNDQGGRFVALLDMIDGTDLLERGLSNWCSAMIFFDTSETDLRRRILAAYIGIPGEAIYFSTRDSFNAFKIHMASDGLSERPFKTPVTGVSTVKSLQVASISYYGQKFSNFLTANKFPQDGRPVVIDFLERESDAQSRIYNFGGNPMMMKLIDGFKRIDCVFELKGQHPHDAVPGLYIALQANAALSDMNGKPMDVENLAEKLMRPASDNPKDKLRYVLSSTKELGAEVVKNIKVQMDFDK